MVRLTDSHSTFNPDPIVRAEIQHQIRPFDPGMVTIYLSIDFPLIRVHSSTFIDDIFELDGHALYSFASSDLNEMAAFIGVKAGQYFASLREPVPSNVTLGDN
jgi:hypothetical protein